jgi:mono/diheme cytochrome c family protein
MLFRIILFALVLVVPWLITSVSAKTPMTPDNITLPKPEKKESKKPPVYSIKRGQLLYENHCQVCHSSVVHIREKRKAKNSGAIRSWVMHWSKYLKLSWSDDEIDEVVHYLNSRYYKHRK